MEKKGIIENNKLIAEFMYGIITKSTDGVFKHNLEHYNFRHDAPTPMGGNVILPEELKYHSSWDWLMPVVQRVNIVNLNQFYGNNDLQRALVSADIKLIYDAILEFIKWHNNNKH